MLLVKTIDLIVLVSKSQGNCRTCTCTLGTIILHVDLLDLRWRLLYFLGGILAVKQKRNGFYPDLEKFFNQWYYEDK